MENQQETTCPSCGFAISVAVNFCPFCGKQLRDKRAHATLFKKIIIYSVSLFLPPFGLIYAVKYLKQGDYESRKIGIISIVFTAISILVTIWLTMEIANSVVQSLNLINSLNI